MTNGIRELGFEKSVYVSGPKCGDKDILLRVAEDGYYKVYRCKGCGFVDEGVEWV